MSSTPTARQIEYLLGDLCSRLGFCLPPEEYDRLLAQPPADVDAFTDAVFEAEGMDPTDSQYRNVRGQARDLVSRTFASPSDAR